VLERKRNYRDLVAGGLLILVGLYIVVQAAISLRIGVLARMGPGLFPVALGVIMTTLGLFISVAALFRSGPAIEGDLK